MTRGLQLLAAGAFLALAACADPTPTPFAPENQPAPRKERVSLAGERSVKPGDVRIMTLERFFPIQQSGDVLIFDVRPGFIHRLGHIPGSRSWPKTAFDSQLPRRAAEIEHAKKAGRQVILYCTDPACPDARSVADRLARLGHTVFILDGGWETWRSAGLPTS